MIFEIEKKVLQETRTFKTILVLLFQWIAFGKFPQEDLQPCIRPYREKNKRYSKRQKWSLERYSFQALEQEDAILEALMDWIDDIEDADDKDVEDVPATNEEMWPRGLFVHCSP